MNQNSRSKTENGIDLKKSYRQSLEHYGINFVQDEVVIGEDTELDQPNKADFFLPDLNLFILIAPKKEQLPKGAIRFVSQLKRNKDLSKMLTSSSDASESSEDTESSLPALYIGDNKGKIFELLPTGELNDKIYFYRCGECTSYGFQSYTSGWLCRNCQSAYSENGRILSWKLKSNGK